MELIVEKIIFFVQSSVWSFLFTLDLSGVSGNQRRLILAILSLLCKHPATKDVARLVNFENKWYLLICTEEKEFLAHRDKMLEEFIELLLQQGLISSTVANEFRATVLHGGSPSAMLH